ncbi:MAG: hypothetical protein EA357_07695 [Micavibrio sp.]|nr:MAG: hypothetical protein EA357_07695 [Micavibrio sp.]
MWKQFTEVLNNQDLRYSDFTVRQNLNMVTALLLVHTAFADEEFHDSEVAVIRNIAQERFGYDDELLDNLIAHVKSSRDGKKHIENFIDTLQRNLSRTETVRFFEDVWQVIAADGVIHPYERVLAEFLADHLEIDADVHKEIERRAMEAQKSGAEAERVAVEEPAASPETQPRPAGKKLTAFQLWLHNHDEKWSFIIVYLGGAVILSIYASLFWVAALMFGHFLLEYWRHIMAKVDHPLRHAIWHTKFDFGLLFFAIVIVLYAELILAALGLGQAARAGQAVRGMQAASRFGVIERALRVFVLIVDELFRFIQIGHTTMKKKKAQKDAPKEKKEVKSATISTIKDVEDNYGVPPWRRMELGDWLSLSLFALTTGFICAAPFILDGGWAQFQAALAEEFIPW